MAKITEHARKMFTGTPSQKVLAFGILGCWFAMGGFIFSAIAYHINDFTTLTVPEGAAGLVGGLIAAITSTIKTV